MQTRRVLQIGDVAGVGADLSRAITDHTDWTVESIPTSQVGAKRGGRIRQALFPLRIVRTAWDTRAAVRRFLPDVIHVHGARWAPLFVRLTTAPLIVHAHGTDVRDRTDSWSGKRVHRALSRADRVLAATPDLLTHLPDDARYVPNPVDLDAFSDLGGPSAGHDEHVLVFARLSAVKGARQILQAIRIIHETSDVEVRAFAGGEFESEAAELGVTILPPTDRDGVVQALQAASVVIGQQHLGVLGRSEMEAMACARPTIAHLSEETYRDDAPPCGPAATPSEIAQTVLMLLSDPAERDDRGRAGRAYIERHHSLPAVAATLASIYEDAAR